MAAPARERCGVADYVRRLTHALPEHYQVRSIELPESVARSHWRAAAMEADDAEVVHVHYEYSLFGTVKPYRNRFLTFLRRVRPPALVTLHDLLPRLEPRWLERPPYRLRDALRDVAYLPFFWQWERSQYGLAEHWLVHTREHEQRVATASGPGRVSRWVHPVPATDTVWWDPRRDGRPAHLVSPGFIKPHKGYSRFVRTVAQLPEVEWTLAGGPQSEPDQLFAEQLAEEIRTFDLVDRIRATGYLEEGDLETRTANSTLAIFPFDRVSGSGSMALAIALGMPIVATDLPGIRELVEEGAGVDLLPTGDPGSWADRLATLLDSPNRLSKLAAANRAFARKHSYARAGLRLAALLDEVSEASRRGALW